MDEPSGLGALPHGRVCLLSGWLLLGLESSGVELKGEKPDQKNVFYLDGLLVRGLGLLQDWSSWSVGSETKISHVEEGEEQSSQKEKRGRGQLPG